MKQLLTIFVLVCILVTGMLVTLQRSHPREIDRPENAGRSEVVFWHFWGGADRDVVDGVVERFNASQDQFLVRSIAMPGNNLQAKLFLAIAGGDPPDLVNQDDPIVGDWGWRGIVQPLRDVCSPQELTAFEKYLFPAAKQLGSYDGTLYAICNGLDIRALYYNLSALHKHGLQPPSSLEELTEIATTITPPGSVAPKSFGYLPDARRLWAWGKVFGGDFFDFETQRVQLTDPAIVAATRWMAQFGGWYGADTINRFRQGDQSLPGKTFPLLPINDQEMQGRYVMLMDGQWRVRDIDAFIQRRRQQGLAYPEFGVCALPPPTAGRVDAGWVNGNFFLVPKGAKNTPGAVAFMKFWIGLGDPEQAAITCAAGGWIPVSQEVVQTDLFQAFLDEKPLFREFVRLASSQNQTPIPVIPGAPMFKREVEKAAANAMATPTQAAEDILRASNTIIQRRLDKLGRRTEQ